jgi:putative ABC transport system substrate-binding protein
MKAMRIALALAVLAALALPMAAVAQPPAKVHRIGYLSPFSAPGGERTPHGCPAQGGNPNWQAMLEGLQERGYVPGRNIVIECRFTEGRAERAPVLAAELVRPDIDLLVVISSGNVRAVKQATSTIPIVFTGVFDPVGRGIVASLARPGGNVTGLAEDAGTQYVGKYVQLAKELVPRASRVAVLSYRLNPLNPLDPVAIGFRLHIEAAAQVLGVTLTFHEVREPDQLEGAFDAMSRAQADALIVTPAPFMGTHARRLVELAAQRKLPAVFPFREHAEAGGLIVYDVNRRAIYRRIGQYVDRIFRGTKPADLPVEQPTEFELIVNLSGARSLGIAIPQSLQVRANEVIP